MKKLLALILCVMMFVAIVPTAAFAAGTTGGVATPSGEQVPKYVDTSFAKKAIENLGKDITAMYTAVAADQTVFGTAKTIYDMTDSLAKELLKDTEKMKIGSVTVYNEDLATNLRKGLNHIIGDQIHNYMNERVAAYTNDNGNVQPDKYLNTFAKAVNNALTSEKAQKNIEMMVYGLAALNAQTKVNDSADDLYKDIRDWDHWNEFDWGELKDPDGRYATAWLPSESMLIPTAGTTVPYDAAMAMAAVSGILNNGAWD